MNAIPPNPVLRSTSIKEITSRISTVEQLDLKAATLEELESVINDCTKGYTSPRFPTAMLGIKTLTRAVKSQDRSIETVKDIQQPPAELVRNYGRANGPNNPIFYAATHQDTAILEMRPEIGNRYVLSQWELKSEESPQVREMGLLETLDRLLPDLASMVRRLLDPTTALGLSVEDLEKQKMIRRFLAGQFTKIVLGESEHEYRLSANIAEKLMKGDSDGVIYASIATTKSGINVALKPSSLQKFYSPLRCAEIEIDEDCGEDKYRAKVLRRSKQIMSDGSINWDS